MTSTATNSTTIGNESTTIAWTELTALHDTITTLQRTISEASAELTAQVSTIAMLREQIATREQWTLDLVADAHAQANHQGYCTDFDDFMENHELPRRTRRYEVTRSYSQSETVTQTCYVEAENEDAAQDLARSEGDWSDADYGDPRPNDDDDYRVEHIN